MREIKIELKEDNMQLNVDTEDDKKRVELEQSEKVVLYEKYDDGPIKQDIKNIKTEQTEQNTEISNLKEDVSNLHNYDDTEVKQSIADIEKEQTEQNEKITKLTEENKLLREQIPSRTSRRRVHTRWR